MRSSRSIHRGRHHFRRLLLEPLEARCLPSFLPAVNYDSGFNTWTVTPADLTGNGIPDLVIPDGAGTVKVLLGNGDGSFLPAKSYAAGAYPFHVAAGDFNGDGIPDLAVAQFGSGGVSVLLGNGDGSFQAPQTYATGSASITVVAADFNGDGILDLAVANEGSHNVSVLLGNGDGSFQPAQNYAAGAQVNWMAAGDFNGDGIPDIVTADTTIPGTVKVLLANGDGSFQAPVSYPAAPGGGIAYSVAVGDFNGDGIPDLAVPNPGAGVSILLGNGDGSFQAPVSYSFAGLNPTFAAVADYNGDGILDLALTNPGNPPNQGLSVLLGNGDGSFQAPTSYAVGQGPEVLAAGDFNGDGFADLAVPNVGNVQMGTVSVLINDANWDGGPSGSPMRHEKRDGDLLAVPPTASQPQSTVPSNLVASEARGSVSQTGQAPWNTLAGQVSLAETASLLLPIRSDQDSMEHLLVRAPRAADAADSPDRSVAAAGLDGLAQNLLLPIRNPFTQA